MRLIIDLQLPRAITIPVNCQDLLQGVVYKLLGDSDLGFALFLHDEGYAASPPADKLVDKLDHRRFKLFTFSGLRAPASRRRVIGEMLHLASGGAQWTISSPKKEFLNHCASGLLSAGVIRVGSAELPIAGICAASTPDFTGGIAAAGGVDSTDTGGMVRAGFTCLTPIVVAVPSPDGRATARYLRPVEGEAFSEAVRKNLAAKYCALHARPPADDRLHLTFSPSYLARDRHQGTKKVTFKNIDLIGALAPFTLEGSPEMLALAWETGLGQGNSAGFGMVELDGRPVAGGTQ